MDKIIQIREINEKSQTPRIRPQEISVFKEGVKGGRTAYFSWHEQGMRRTRKAHYKKSQRV